MIIIGDPETLGSPYDLTVSGYGDGKLAGAKDEVPRYQTWDQACVFIGIDRSSRVAFPFKVLGALF